MKNNWSSFRAWVHQIWVQNCEEHVDFGERPWDAKEYFEQYKYWLKREFKYQQKVKND